MFGTIEAVKTVSDMFMPVSGEILELNPALEETPDVVNKDPYGKGWMVKIKITNPSETASLLTADQYKALLVMPSVAIQMPDRRNTMIHDIAYGGAPSKVQLIQILLENLKSLLDFEFLVTFYYIAFFDIVEIMNV